MRKRFPARAFDAWPRLDQQLWRAATMDTDPFDHSSVSINWRPATITTVLNAYAIALQWLVDRNALDESVAPSKRWPVSILQVYLADLARQLSPATVRHRIVHLERALAMLEPTGDRTPLRALVNSLPRTTNRHEKRKRLQDPVRLTELGFSIMERAEAGEHTSVRKNASLFRIGLQIALLALRPMRMANMSAIRIGKHLVREDKDWLLRFACAETKNHRALELVWPTVLVGPLECYLTRHRPLLVGGRYGGDRLWVSYRFQPESRHTLQLSIVRATQSAFGQALNPHLFRDCVATSIAVNSPAEIRVATELLGHATLATTQQYYNLAHTLEAGRSYANVVELLRKQSHDHKRGTES